MGMTRQPTQGPSQVVLLTQMQLPLYGGMRTNATNARQPLMSTNTYANTATPMGAHATGAINNTTDINRMQITPIAAPAGHTFKKIPVNGATNAGMS